MDEYEGERTVKRTEKLTKISCSSCPQEYSLFDKLNEISLSKTKSRNVTISHAIYNEH